MSEAQQIVGPGTVILPMKQSAIAVMASRVNVEPEKLLATLKATVFQNATNEELLALVVVANVYQLNPFLKEIYAFPNQRGGIIPLVPIDGWTRIVNREPDFDGVEFEFEEGEDGKPVSCTATMHAKSRSHPIRVTEYYKECHRNTPPWNTMPRRMLRHKAYMQAARVAYGLSGIFDEDEAKDAVKRAEVLEQETGVCGGEKVVFGEAVPEPAPAEPKKKTTRKKQQHFIEGTGVPLPVTPEVTEPAPAPESPEPEMELEPTEAVTPLAQLRRKLLSNEMTEAQFKRYLIIENHIEPNDRFETMADQRLLDMVNSFDSIVEDVRASIRR